MRRLLAVVLLLLAGGACAGDDAQSDVHATGSLAATTTTGASGSPNTTIVKVGDGPIVTTVVNGKPHFSSPEDAMRFLADAWNRRDMVNLKHVTNPAARDELESMHGVAVNLRLNHCAENKGEGDYMCHFDHDYPPRASTTMTHDHADTKGEAIFRVGPADTPGWYMTVFESCS